MNNGNHFKRTLQIFIQKHAEAATALNKWYNITSKEENEVLKIMPLPVTINIIVQYKMNELNITQAKLAEMLNLGTSKLSQILNGKREPDVHFLKAVHTKLGISGDFFLESV